MRPTTVYITSSYGHDTYLYSLFKEMFRSTKPRPETPSSVYVIDGDLFVLMLFFYKTSVHIY